MRQPERHDFKRIWFHHNHKTNPYDSSWHRRHGPAIEGDDGSKGWWMRGYWIVDERPDEFEPIVPGITPRPGRGDLSEDDMWAHVPRGSMAGMQP